MRGKTGAVILVSLLAAVLISGCQGSKAAGAEGKKMYYAAMESGDYYEGWATGLKGQAGKFGFAFKAGYAEKSVEMQAGQVKKAFADGYSVFLCGLVQADIAPEIKAAAGQTPIIFINNAPKENQLEKGRYIYVASDEFMAGQYQAEYILEKLGHKDEINIVLLKGPKDASGTRGRTEGLKQTLKASGKKINYVFEDYADWKEELAEEMVQLFLETGKPVDCIAANNDDMALGGIAAFEKAGIAKSQTLFLGVDASEKGCEAIADGKMDFTVYQAVAKQMEAAVEAAKRLQEGSTIEGMEGASEDGKYIFIPFEKVDAENVAQYQ